MPQTLPILLLGQALANRSLISSTGRIIGMSAGRRGRRGRPAVLFVAAAVGFRPSSAPCPRCAPPRCTPGRVARGAHVRAAPLAAVRGEQRAVRAGFRYLATQPVMLAVALGGTVGARLALRGERRAARSSWRAASGCWPAAPVRSTSRPAERPYGRI
ncbi:hypothetical protein GCM10010399_42610 [Dactylosporangium fulvum]|uniref:Uncharacterized protein n=1 Tax=Dactylosporangium fulvum TaxID=53359 RepID=A0ABY5VWR7_9ACTN|nr:hypothetical protein [Dactylosporangium fulvum]UWP81561.1 hypothetical protein Dfulv_41650 [Dactylosporangium fulvum]